MRTRWIYSLAALGAGVGLAVTAWIAFPTTDQLAMPSPLAALESKAVSGPYSADFAPLARAFRPQTYRSFCGPASIATVLRAYGVHSADQRAIFPSIGYKLDTFYSGVSLAQLAELAQRAGLRTETAYADTMSLDEFRERLKSNLGRANDFVLVNYDRRTLKQEGAGHISAVGAYDEVRDAFLVLDQAAYKYPFTWIPAPLLYDAVHTRADGRFRGVLLISELSAAPH